MSKGGSPLLQQRFNVLHEGHTHVERGCADRGQEGVVQVGVKGLLNSGVRMYWLMSTVEACWFNSTSVSCETLTREKRRGLQAGVTGFMESGLGFWVAERQTGTPNNQQEWHNHPHISMPLKISMPMCWLCNRSVDFKGWARGVVWQRSGATYAAY
jgi:hypothetical protein